MLVRHGVTAAHRRQALLRRPGERQPGPHRRGPGAGPGHRRLAGAAGRARSTRWSPRRCAAPASPPRSSPSGSAGRWSSRAGLRRDGVRHLGRDDLRRGAASATPTTWTPGSARSTHAPGGGESSAVVEKRVLAGLDRVLAEHAGQTVVVVSHVTPIKMLVAHALGGAAGVGVPDGAGAGVGDACCRSSPTATPRCGCSTRARPDGRRSQVADDHVELACRAGRRGPARRSSRGAPRWSANRAGRARVRAVLQQRADEPALGRLVEVARPPCRRAVDLVQHPQGHDPAGQVRRRAPERRRTSTSAGRPPARGRRLRARARRARRASTSTRCRCPGSDDVAGEPVGRDPVAGPQQPEQARGHHQPATWPGGGPRPVSDGRPRAS